MRALLRGGALLLALGACLLLAYSIARVAQRGRFAAPYSSYGAGPDGTRALLLLVRALGREARPFTRELSHLPRGTLVLIGGCKAELLRKVARPEREALTRWVEDGGLLIVAGDLQVLPEAAGLSVARRAACRKRAQPSPLEELLAPDPEPRDVLDAMPDTLAASGTGAPLTHLLSFDVDDALGLRVAHDAEATEILSSDAGPLGLTAPFGRGRLVLLGIPEALTNGAVSDGGGLVFARLLSAFAPPGPVMFDEYHLGMGERRSLIGYLRDAGYAPLLTQLLLVALAFMLAGAARLSPARDTPRPSPAAARDFPEALAGLYERTRDAQGALQVLAQSALERVARHYHAQALGAEPLARWLAARGLHAVASYVRRLGAHQREPLAPGETLVARASAISEDERAAIALGEA